MYIAMNESLTRGREIMEILPQDIRKLMFNIDFEEAEELRLIAGKPLAVRFSDGIYYLSRKAVLVNNVINAVTVTSRHMEELIERITKSSLYSVQNEIRSGYITIDGGHRVGLAGTAVTENGTVEFIKNISAVNIRLAHERKGAAEPVIGAVAKDGLKSALIVSPPGAGKTTMLRDMARSLSYKGYSVAIADERCELAAMYNGKSPFDLGNMTSVLDNCPKAQAMLMLLRSMSPEVIITDEIGTAEDAEAVRNIMNSGVAVMASIHGRDIGQLMQRRCIKNLVSLFDVVVTLSRRGGAGTIEEIKENV